MIMKIRRVVRSVCYTVTLVFTMQVQSVWILWPECDKDSGHTGERVSRVSTCYMLGVGRGDLGSARIARVHAFLLSTHPLTCLEHTGSATTHKNNGQPDVRSRKISIFSRQRPREP